jgi:6-phosphogluconate dehydrogenase
LFSVSAVNDEGGEVFNNMLESILDAIEQKGGGKEIQIDIW